MADTYTVYHAMDAERKKPLGTVTFDDSGKFTGGSWSSIVKEQFMTTDDLTVDDIADGFTSHSFEKGRRVVKRDDDMDLRTAGEIVKTDPAKQNVFGWAYVAITKDGEINVDKSGDFIDEIEEVEDAAYDYVLKSRAADADHTNVKGGEMVESIVFTPEKIEKMGIPEGAVPLGWWVGFHIDDKATWERVEKGELKAFSIHGRGIRSKVDDS